MIVREPIAAGRLYPTHPDRCQADLVALLAGGWSIGAEPRALYGGIVPNGPWAECGSVIARVFRALSTGSHAQVIVLFGGVDSDRVRRAALFDSGRWETPLGPLQVDERLADRLMGHTNLIAADVHAFEQDRSIEIQTPFIRHLFPGVKILPILIPASDEAHEVGEAVARTLDVYDYKAIVVGATNLTTFGSGNGSSPRGDSPDGFARAHQQNDARMVDLISGLRSREVIAEAAANRNADQSGALAASIRAAVAMGATEASLLQQTNSAEVAVAMGIEELAESVGYAGFVYH